MLFRNNYLFSDSSLNKQSLKKTPDVGKLRVRESYNLDFMINVNTTKILDEFMFSLLRENN